MRCAPRASNGPNHLVLCALQRAGKCMESGQDFSFFNRKHHCRRCGGAYLGDSMIQVAGPPLLPSHASRMLDQRARQLNGLGNVGWLRSRSRLSPMTLQSGSATHAVSPRTLPSTNHTTHTHPPTCARDHTEGPSCHHLAHHRRPPPQLPRRRSTAGTSKSSRSRPAESKPAPM